MCAFNKGAGGSADLKINKSAPLSLNHHTFSNTEPIYTNQVSRNATMDH